jgi:hypothetical protein
MLMSELRWEARRAARAERGQRARQFQAGIWALLATSDDEVDVERMEAQEAVAVGARSDGWGRMQARLGGAR